MGYKIFNSPVQKFAYVLFLLFMSVTSNAWAQAGEFLTPINVRLLEDGRKLQLLETIKFKDSKLDIWTVPEEAIVDGASIPKPFWTVVGPPLVGLYRDASIVHDFFCDIRTKPWQEVHRVFYDAMIARDVPWIKAKLMYAAVYRFGPRWAPNPNRELAEPNLVTATPKYDQIVADNLENYIQKENPSLEDIDQFAEKTVKINIRNGILNMQNNSNCSPVLSNVYFLNNVSFVCNMNPATKKLNAHQNLEVLLRDLRKLYLTNSSFLLPSVRRYASNPTDSNWNIVKKRVNRTISFVNLAIESALDYDASLIDQVGPTLGELYGILAARASLLSQIQSEMPTNIRNWENKYKILVEKLQIELEQLQEKL